MSEPLKELLQRLDGMTYGHSDDDRADVLAAALRHSREDALNEAAQICDEEQAEYWTASRAFDAAGNHFSGAAEAHGACASKRIGDRIRAIASPAAAPAASPHAPYCCTDAKAGGPDHSMDCPHFAVPTTPDLRGALVEAKEALEDIWAAIGDRLCGKGPLSKEYAHGVTQKVNAALERLRFILAVPAPPAEPVAPAPPFLRSDAEMAIHGAQSLAARLTDWAAALRASLDRAALADGGEPSSKENHHD